MNDNDRWAMLLALDDELLRGGVMVSEWCSLIVRDADIAFAAGAFLASILTAVSGIETYLRAEYGESARPRLAELIDVSDIGADLKVDLHRLRRYRNGWVHVEDPNDDQALLENVARVESELETMALFAVRTLRRTIYSCQCV